MDRFNSQLASLKVRIKTKNATDCKKKDKNLPDKQNQYI